METTLWYYGFGKPKERIELLSGHGEVDLSTLSLEDLTARAEALSAQLREARRLELPPPLDADFTVRVASMPTSKAITADSAARENSFSDNELHARANENPPAFLADEDALAREELIRLLAEEASEGRRSVPNSRSEIETTTNALSEAEIARSRAVNRD